MTNVLAKRPTDVITFFELSLIITSHVSLVCARIDQLSFVFSFFIWHCAPPLINAELQWPCREIVYVIETGGALTADDADNADKNADQNPYLKIRVICG